MSDVSIYLFIFLFLLNREKRGEGVGGWVLELFRFRMKYVALSMQSKGLGGLDVPMGYLFIVLRRKLYRLNAILESSIFIFLVLGVNKDSKILLLVKKDNFWEKFVPELGCDLFVIVKMTVLIVPRDL